VPSFYSRADGYAAGHHDIYGFALAAHPGKSQGRPPASASSQLIEQVGLPVPMCSQRPCPGWSHHAPQASARGRQQAPSPFIPLTNLLERSLEEVKRRTKVIGRFPGETSCLSLCWAVLNLFIASARGFGLTPMEQRQLTLMQAQRMALTPGSRTG
jgi:hypothetical protein